MNKKIKFLPTNVQECRWRIKNFISTKDLNLLIKHFQCPRLISDETGDCKYVPFGLSNEFKNGGYRDDYIDGTWMPMMFVPDYNKQYATKIPLESTDIYDCIYKLHDMFPQFTEYWDVVGVTKEEYWEEILEKCESYEILGVTSITTDLVKGNENYKIPVNSVVSYLVDGEIKSVVFDKKLHRII
jgi:hypothetical protein